MSVYIRVVDVVSDISLNLTG